MRWDMRQKPEFAICRVEFENPGEQIVLEGAAMVAKDTSVQMKTGMRGGLMGGLKRMVSGESLFQNTFTASRPGESVWFAPGPDGDMDYQMLDGSHDLILASSAYVASEPQIELDTKFGGLRGFLGKTGLFFVKCSGVGAVWFCGYGAIHAVDIQPGQSYIVDNSHVVGFTGGLDFNIRGMGGLKSFVFGGEALVCEFSGQGRVWISTRSPGALAAFLFPFRPRKSSN